MNGLSRPKSKSSEFVRQNNAPILIEGIEEYDCLCPVSKLTGHRANPLSMLKVALSDKNSRLLSAILQEVPVIDSDPRISDEDKLNTLVSRLDVGTLAEHDNVTRVLSDFADYLFPSVDKSDDNAEKIAFSPSDSPNVDVSPSE